MKNRYLLQLLLCGLMLYYALPRLDVYASGAEGFFSISWLVFALLVIAGSLNGLLYTSKKKSVRIGYVGQDRRTPKTKGTRSYS